MRLIAFLRGSFAIHHLLSVRVGGRRHLTAAIAAVLAVGVGWIPARADSVTATFSNVNPGEVVTIPVNGGTESGWAGDYNFVNASGAFTGSFSGFCIDIAQDIFTNQTVTFNVTALANAPVDGNQPTAMGTLRAELIGELWYNDFALVGTSNSNATAFQLAIWEIVNETHTNSNGMLALNIYSGTFYATDQDSTALATANTWLGQLNLYGTGLMASGLEALTNSTYQDYVVQDSPPVPAPSPTPAPPGLVLSAIGAVCMFLSSAFRKSRLTSAAA